MSKCHDRESVFVGLFQFRKFANMRRLGVSVALSVSNGVAVSGIDSRSKQSCGCLILLVFQVFGTRTRIATVDATGSQGGQRFRQFWPDLAAIHFILRESLPTTEALEIRLAQKIL